MPIVCPGCESSPLDRATHRAAGRCLIDAALRQMAAEGKTRAEMADRLGIKPGTVSRHLGRMGIATPKRRAPVAPPGADAVIWQLREQGVPCSEIAKRLGMSKEAVGKRHARLVGMLASPTTREEALRRIGSEPSRQKPKRGVDEKIRAFAEQLIADGWLEHQAWSRARECYAPDWRASA